MNVTEYIASGILESYVLGAVSDQEKREVECLSAIYPEVRNELDELSAALENYALLHSLEPPTALKTQLMDQLEFNEAPNTIVRPMPVDRNSAPTYRSTWIVAASVGLLVLIFSFFLLSQLRTNQNTMASLRNANGSLQSEVKQLRDAQLQADQTLALLRQPGTRTLELKGNDKAPVGNMLVFWNARTKQVAVEVRSLPPLGPDQQYQLWSLVDGKPVDAGVFEADSQHQLVQRLNRPIGRADAFAVTVEKRGGSPTPTLSTLLAMTPVNV
jgi:anti-sigma-K factor RskA